MPTRTIPCVDCDETRRRLEMTGHRVISCDPRPDDAQMCVITFERVTAAAAPKQAKSKARAKTRPKARKARPAATKRRKGKATRKR